MGDEEATSQEQPTVQALMLRAEDEMYLIPQETLDTFRLSDEQRAEVEAKIAAADDDDDVQGYMQLELFRVQANMDSYKRSFDILSRVNSELRSAQDAIIRNMRP